MSLPAPAPRDQILVTGASSGIGAEIARRLATRGHNVVLVARRTDRLDTLSRELSDAHGVSARVIGADLSAPGPRRSLIGGLTEDSPLRTVGLVNCAGYGSSGLFAELPRERELGQIDLNITALVELTHALVAPMLTWREGAILNVASLAAFQPIPGLATYSATKAFVQTFSEALHEELRGSGVSCTVLCPGPVETEWAEIADARAFMIGPAKVRPAAVAATAVDGMVSGRRSVIPGRIPQAAATAGRYAPRSVLLPLLHHIAGH